MAYTKRGLIVAFALLVCVFLMPATALAQDHDTTDSEYGIPPQTSYTSGEETAPATLPEPVAAVRVWRNTMLSQRNLSRRQEGLDIINPIVPDIAPAFGPEYALINEQISEVVTNLISEARRVRARNIAFDFEHHVSGDIVSIVIFADLASATPPRTLARSVNFSLQDGRILSMNEAMGMNIIPLTERILADKIRRDPARYYAALYAPLESQAFYITGPATGGELVLLFDGLRLSSQYGGVDSISLRRANIHTVTITRSEYFVRSNGYSLMMLPVAQVARGLGYEVGWDSEERRVYIKRNSRLLAEFWPGDNHYAVVGAQPRSLEAAPELRSNDRTYVPITFFDHILPLTTYSIDAMGSITFIAYLDSTN